MTMQVREFKGTYNEDLVYGDGDMVFCHDPITRTSNFFESLSDGNVGNNPYAEGSPWRSLTIPPNIVISDTDAWSADVLYPAGKLATYNGAAFYAKYPNIGQTPDINGSLYWDVIATTITTRHAATHQTGGRDAIPIATNAVAGLMGPAHVTALEDAIEDISIMQGAGVGNIANNTVVGNVSGAPAPSSALTKAQLLTLLDVTPVSGKTIPVGIIGNGSATELATTAAVINAIDDALSGAGSSIVAPVADLAALQALDTTSAEEFPDKVICTVSGVNAIFRLSRTSTLTANGTDIIQPTVGVGRWIKIQDSLTDHALLSNLQGGAVGERYHLTVEQVTKLVAIPDDVASPYTGAEIAALYENEADRNAFTDAEKAKLGYITATAPVDLSSVDTAISANASAIIAVDTLIDNHIANISNPHSTTAAQLGLSNAWTALCNFAGSAVPGVTDDVNSGYSARSLWFYGTRVFVCASASAGAAVWLELSGGNSITLGGQAGSYYLARANHTGTQVAATISDFASAVNAIIAATSVTSLIGITNVGSGAIITAAERSKLGGIEAGATGDMTPTEIMLAYEGLDDRNAFSDAEKAKLAEINLSNYLAKATYDPNNRAADAFNSANTDYDNQVSGLAATKVKTAIDAVKALCDGLVAGGSTGALQYKNAQGKLSGFAAYDATARTINMATTALVNFRTKHVDLGNVSGNCTISDPDQATSYTATVTGAITSFGVSPLMVESGQLTAADHVFTVLFVNPSAYAITAGSSVKWLNGTAPNFAVAGNHLCTFKKDPRGTNWIAQYNGTVA